MPCYRPIAAYRAARVNPDTGKRGIVFNRHDGLSDMPVTVPCGQCIGCRLERSRQWAIRLVHENQVHEDSCFLTLTYDNKHLPADQSLDVEHFKKFMKRLRKHVHPKKIRYFHCGEYGETTFRPHYHAIIFGHDFPDRRRFSERDGITLYTSETLDRLWSHGHCTIGNVTFESAGYVARYVVKKVTGDLAEEHYTWIDAETGEVHRRRPEYTTMSLKPAIGFPWWEKYGQGVIENGTVVIRGKEMKPPRRYLDYLKEEAPRWSRKHQAKRLSLAKQNAVDNTDRRLHDREVVKEAQLTQLKRTLD